MSCSACGHENRDTARFCGACAAPLASAPPCPGCGRPNPQGQQFCDACGGPLAATPGTRDPRAYTPKRSWSQQFTVS
jgi:predicted amidophosphoribosyltransferase